MDVNVKKNVIEVLDKVNCSCYHGFIVVCRRPWHRGISMVTERMRFLL
jgi:hypothetical protein